jgi:hypothetical protein
VAAAEPAKAPRNPLRTNRFMAYYPQRPARRAPEVIGSAGWIESRVSDHGMLRPWIGWARKGYKDVRGRVLRGNRINLIGYGRRTLNGAFYVVHSS